MSEGLLQFFCLLVGAIVGFGIFLGMEILGVRHAVKDQDSQIGALWEALARVRLGLGSIEERIVELESNRKV